MKRFLSITQKLISSLCWMIIVWFAIYFSWGEKISLEFESRCISYSLPEILVFSTGAAIYLLFIFSMKSRRKWWQNLILFLVGFIFATIPFLLYHGYFQYQCKFWTQQRTNSEIIYRNKFSPNQFVETRSHTCVATGSQTKDTVIVSPFIPHVNKIQKVSEKNLTKSLWIKAK